MMKTNLKRHLPLILLLTGIGTELGAIYQVAKKGSLICTEVSVLVHGSPALEDLGYPQRPKKEMAKELAKNSFLPVALTSASITSYVIMYCMQRNQIIGLTAALTASIGQYEFLRNKLKEKHSEEDIQDFERPKFDWNDRRLKSEQKGFWYINSPFYFDNCSEYNLAFIEMTDKDLTNLANEKGYLLINDILEMFEIDGTPEGKVLGWSKEHWTGLITKDIFTGQDEVTGEMRYEIWVSWPQVEMIL